MLLGNQWSGLVFATATRPSSSSKHGFQVLPVRRCRSRIPQQSRCRQRTGPAALPFARAVLLFPHRAPATIGVVRLCRIIGGRRVQEHVEWFDRTPRGFGQGGCGEAA